MRMAVIGAGVIGVTTAYELAADGHEVVVFERCGSVAEEASFANAGVLAPGYVTPWAAPGMPGKVLRQMLGLPFGRHAAARLRWPLSAADVAWALRFKRAANMQSYARNRRAMQTLALYSQTRLQELTQTLELEYDRAQGYTVLLRSESDARLIEPSLSVLRELGQRFEQLNEEGVRKIEPAINPDTHFFGGVHLPNDGVGNCRQFTQLLKAQAQARGAQFRFGQQVLSIASGSIAGSGVTVYTRSVILEDAPTTQLESSNSGWSQSGGFFTRAGTGRDATGDATQVDYFDHVVVCAGVRSNPLLQSLGLKLPLVPVYGYSISAQVREPLNAPSSAVMDERYKVAISRLGLRVRVAGSAELGGRPGQVNQASVQTLYKVLHDWFPGAANNRRVQTWKGARPMLPDGPPIIGASGTPRIWLNLGHGSSGWALACGSARALADQLAGRSAEVDMSGLGLERLLR
jgi:D-amino-acid dehydrogenase